MSEKNIYKVISIMNHSSSDLVYDYSKKPKFVFNNDDNNQVVLCEDEWPDQLGKYVTELDKDIIFEIWQPDLIADKIYSAEISERVIHRLFPACMKRNLLGLYFYSEKLLQEVSIQNNTIFQIGLPSPFYYDVINNIKKENKIVGTSVGEIRIPHQNIIKLRKNQLRTAGHIVDYFKFIKNIHSYNVIAYLNDNNINKLRKYYNGKFYEIGVGIDISVFRELNKYQCRKELNLYPEKKIILSVGRLNPAKQNHKLINILNELSIEFDFLAIFIGNGELEYENYLKNISQNLQNKNQILFTGYVDLNELVKYYNSADIFFMSSESEGAPVVSMEALACGIPVITTDTGKVAEFIMKHIKNNIVGKYNYSEWKSVLTKFLNGEKINKISVEYVKNKYSWDSVAWKYIEIYRNL